MTTRLVRVSLAVLLALASVPLVLGAADSDLIHYLTTLGTPHLDGMSPGTFTYPRPLAFDQAGRLYAGDDTGRIQIYGPDHNPLYALAPPLDGFAPQGIAIDATGRMLVSDMWNDKVMLFGAAGNTTPPQLIASVGESENHDPLDEDPAADGWLPGPPPIDRLVTWGAWGVAIKAGTVLQDPAAPAPASAWGRVAVVDNGNHRVVVLNSKLQPLYDFGGHAAGSDAPQGSFEYPQGIAIDAAGLFYIADTDNSRVQVFKEVADAQGRLHGQFVRMFGSAIEAGRFVASPGDLHHPQSLSFDAVGRLWITDSQRHRLLRVDVRHNIDAAGLTSCVGVIGLAGTQPCFVATDDHQNYAAIAMGTGPANGGAGANAVFQVPGGVAANVTELAVADTGDHVVQLFDFPTLALVFEGGGWVQQPNVHRLDQAFQFSVALRNSGGLPLRVSLVPTANPGAQSLDGEFGGDLIADIQPNQTHSFGMTFTPHEPGSLALQVAASGEADMLFGGRLNAGPGPLPLDGGVVPPVVGVTMSTLSSLSLIGAPGDTFLLSLRIRNTGATPLTNVLPYVAIDQSSTFVSTDDAFVPFDLAALEARQVDYHYRSHAAGTATLRPSVTASNGTGEPHQLQASATPVQLTISNDLLAPATTATTSAPPSVWGWYRQPVTIHFAATDNAGGSGVDATYSRLVEDNQAWTALGGSDLTLNFTGVRTIAFYSRDRGGNSEAQHTLTLKIDPDPPTIRTSVITSATPPVNGWYTSDPTITFNADENLSGIALITPPITITTDGANQTVTGFAVDKAGNRSPDAQVAVNVDTTAPVLACGVAGGPVAWPPNHRMATLNFSVSVTDRLSGVAMLTPGGARFRLVAATSSEPANGSGDGNTTVDLSGWSLGTPDTSGEVRAERGGTGTGRIYTFVYEARDNAGNSGTCAISVAVPHDEGKK